MSSLSLLFDGLLLGAGLIYLLLVLWLIHYTRSVYRTTRLLATEARPSRLELERQKRHAYRSSASLKGPKDSGTGLQR